MRTTTVAATLALSAALACACLPACAQDGAKHAQSAREAAPDAAKPPSYGPVLTPRRPPSDPARTDPAEVGDETASQSRATDDTREQPQQQFRQASQQQRRPPLARRHPAWQPGDPMAPRPLRAGEMPAIGTGLLPIAPPATAPQPVVPSSAPLVGCIGGVCRDAAGGTINVGPNGTGVSSTGRLCSTTGTTVQCF